MSSFYNTTSSLMATMWNTVAGPGVAGTHHDNNNNDTSNTPPDNHEGGGSSCFVNQVSIPPSPPPSPFPPMSPTMFASPPVAAAPPPATTTTTGTQVFPTSSPKRGRSSISSTTSTTSLPLSQQQQAPAASSAAASPVVGGTMTTRTSSSAGQKQQQASSSSSSSNEVIIDLSTTSDDADDDDDDNQKMPATKKQKTVATSLQQQQQQQRIQVEERKQQEQNAMMLSNTGRAFKLVETLIQMHRTTMKEEGNDGIVVELVGQDDIVFLTERFLECQQRFVANNKPIHVSLAYHFTQGHNLRSIRQDGLLSHPERKSKNISARRAAHFGDGVYTASNPYAFRHFGDTGLLCAILKGTEARVGPGGTSDPNVNTAIGNKGRGDSPYTEETVLRDCCQVLPILRFSSTMVHSSGSLTYDGNALLWKFHVQVQKVLDKFFNRNVATAVVRVTPHDPFEPTPLHKIQQRMQRAAAAPPPPVPPMLNTGLVASNPPLPPTTFAPIASKNLHLIGVQQPQPPAQPKKQSAFASSAATSQALQNLMYHPASAAVPQFQGQAAATPSSTFGTNNANTATATAAERDKESRRQKERFLMFTRVLMKYLETKDPPLHQKVKEIIRDCADRNKRGERGYESVTASMRERLKHVVGDAFWKRAESYLEHFLKKKQRPGGGTASTSKSQPSPHLPHATAVTPNPALQQGAAIATFPNPMHQAGTVSTHSNSAVNQVGLNGPIRPALSVPPPTLVPVPTHVANNPPIQREVLQYVAPKTLVTADDCCHRVRTLSRLEDCAICFTKLQSKGKVLQLYSCGCLFHSDCITAALQHDSKCPKCRVPVSKHPQGRSPSGTMTISHTSSTCSGFGCGDSNGSIQLSYSFPSGIQLPYHETPGQPYSGNRRSAYLPNNQDGRNLLNRFKYAWSKGLLFSVGTSLTTGKSGQVVWGSVHQKSSMSGGGHGFPDPNYFANANAELDGLGVPQHDKL